MQQLNFKGYEAMMKMSSAGTDYAINNWDNFRSSSKNSNVISFPKSDEFHTNIKEDKSNNGKFDLSECVKNFAKGVLSPITAFIEHPVITLATIGITAAACTAIPVLGPIMAVGFGILSAYQLGKGVYNVVKNYKTGEFDQAEKSFNEVGQGTVGLAMTALGMKQSAKTAREAKMMSELGTNSLNQAQREAIALEVKNGSFIDATKDVGSLFTSKAGWRAIGNQFKPSNIAQRVSNTFKFLFKKEEIKTVKKDKAEFAKTAEGKRRANLTSEEIKAEVESLYKEACDEYGIPEELRPKIEITKESAYKGGSYSSDTHTISINENSYREGVFDLPDVIKHESTHANEAILRQRLPMDEKEKLTVEYLIDKIQNGEKDTILTGKAGFLTGNDTMKPPSLNSDMKAAFSKLAKEKLYKLTTYSDDELSAMVKPIVDANPDFVKGYDSVDDAIKVMTDYARSHNCRYQIAVKNSSGFNTKGVDTSLLSELTPEEKIAAIKSYRESIDCIESNAANNKGIGSVFGLGDFDQYQFTPEEVLAQQEGNSFEISKLKAQLENLRASENYDIAEEARLLDQIKKCELTIEYKTKGKEMYRLYTESFNHPENEELALQVQSMKDDLSALNKEITSIVSNNEYSIQTELKRPDIGASVNIPISTSVACDIIGDNIKE